ncbi:MAG: hypothetical protein COB84_00375 [Rhodobacteraceae bacterium]|nr:MAG: hypothetical protein COB84_00375 [Paracoccaceae bacterium]
MFNLQSEWVIITAALGLSLLFMMCLFLRIRRAAPDIGTSLPPTFKYLLKSAPFLTWAERAGKPLWGNTLVKRNHPDVLHKGQEALIDDHGRIPYKICKQTLGKTDYFFALEESKTNPVVKDKFVQTLSVTFAQMQLGLAIFDDNGQLALFNPALSQHLNLSVEWMLKKPSLLSFLDQLRDLGTLPEPKDYASWRNTFKSIERAAFKDDYQQDWLLPDGRTLRVTGRPHLTKGIVFIFEDVTSIVQMSEDFQTKTNELMTILNGASTGLVMIDSKGNILRYNHAFTKLLNTDKIPDTVIDLTRILQEIFEPTPVWGDLRDFVVELEHRATWQADVKLPQDISVSLVCTPLSNGNCLCEFTLPQTFINIDQGIACAAE